MIAQDVRRDLEAVGATVLGPVATVEQALRLVSSEPTVHAGVLDVNLGGKNSFPVAEALEARKIPFLFATGYDFADIPAAWQHATITLKPLRIEAVRQLLAAANST